VSVCLSVHLSVTLVYSVETNKDIFKIFILHHQVATPFYFLHTKRYGNIQMGTTNGGVDAGGYEKISIFNQCLASSRVVNGATVTCYKHSGTGPWKVGDTCHWWQ